MKDQNYRYKLMQEVEGIVKDAINDHACFHVMNQRFDTAECLVDERDSIANRSVRRLLNRFRMIRR